MRTFYLYFLLISFGIQAQHFSGKITYKFSIQPKNANANIEELRENLRGDSATYLITDKYYKSTYYKNGKVTYSYTYHDETKRMYDAYSERPYITYRDSRKANVKDLGSTVYRDSTTTVLGMECFMVTSESDRAKSVTYYSDDIKVNYESFKGHQVGNWYKKLKQVDGCITIKTITEFKDYYEIQEAIKIEKYSVAKKEFDLPISKTIAASFEALDTQVEMLSPSQETIDCYRSKLGLIKPGNDKHTVYVQFIVTKDGTLKFIAPYQKDEMRFYRIAVDIVKNCGLEFKPGLIDGKAVNSEVYFPVEFSFEKKN